MIAVHDRFGMAHEEGGLSDEFDAVGVVEENVTWRQAILVNGPLVSGHADEVIPEHSPTGIDVVHAELDDAAGVALSACEAWLGFGDYVG